MHVNDILEKKALNIPVSAIHVTKSRLDHQEVAPSFHMVFLLYETSLVHSKLDYCNSLLLNLPSTTQINRRQLAVNSAARFGDQNPLIPSCHSYSQIFSLAQTE
jgi:hypothetical protein